MIGMVGMLGAFGLLIYYATTRKQHPRSFMPGVFPRLSPMQSIVRTGDLMRRGLLNIKRPIQAIPPGASLNMLLNR